MKQSAMTQFFDTFVDRQVPFHSAALAFYMVIALPAFLLFFVSLAGIFLTPETIQSGLASAGLIDAVAFEEIGQQVVQFSSWTAGISLLIMLWTGSAIFHRVQQGLREMWQIRLDIGRGIKAFVAKKMLAMIAALMFVVGIVLLYIGLQTVGVLVTVFGDTGSFVQDLLGVAHILQVLLLVSVIAIMYSTFGDAHISWQLVSIASAFVAAMIWLVQLALHTYVNTIALVTMYGAAGSVVVLLISLFLLSNVFYAGAVGIYVAADRSTTWTLKPRSYADQLNRVGLIARIKSLLHT